MSNSSHLSPPSQNSPINNNPIILRLHKSLIRPFTQTDAAALAKEANNPKIARWMRNTFPHPYSIEDATKWINITTSASPTLDFAICQPPPPPPIHKNDKNHDHDHDHKEENTTTAAVLIGGIGLKPLTDVHYRTMQIGFWLGEMHWGQGIVSEAVEKFSEWTFKWFVHVVRLEAEVYEGNDASMKVLERAGFAFEGRSRNAVEKNGRIMGLVRYVRFREGW